MSTATRNGRRAAPPVQRSGEYPASAPRGDVDEAQAYEDAIREEAEAIRGEQVGIDAALFLKLWPLLRRHLHPGHIVHTTAGKGKPYESDGARSVQVLVDRMNNVLTPIGWCDEVEYHEDGKLCEVTVHVVTLAGEAIVSRASWGGVNQGSTLGNIRKGSYTNAAKLAFARLGPGHEVYLGAIDLDPDVNPEIAAQQEKASPERTRRSNAGTGEQAPVEDADAALAALLAEDGPLKTLRADADQGMKILGASPAQRLRELRAAADERSLNALLARVHAAADGGE